MSLSITLHPHTVYILCGPTMSGKSTFAEHLVEFANKNNLTGVYLGSDLMRESFLSVSSILQSDNDVLQSQDNEYRHSSAMLATSRQAFESIFSSLKIAVSYPINADVIVVDTTGFDENFRKDISKIARDNSYRVELITFEYKTRAEYFPKAGSADTIFNVGKSLDKFRKNVLPKLGAKDYDGRIRIKDRNNWTKDFAELETVFQYEVDEYKGNYRVNDLFAVIGDSHECVEELELLIHTLEDKYPGVQIIHIGDYLDKGLDTVKMIDFIHERVVNGKDWMIVGNHESYVHKRFNSEISNPDLTMEAANFTSIAALEKAPESVGKFNEIFSISLPFLVIGKDNDASVTPVVITHAPCQNRYVGKMSSYALREQRNYRTVDRSVSWFKELDWFFKEADMIFPIHVVGHVSHKVTTRNGHKFKNKLFLDTGCVNGNTLSGAVFQGARLIDIVEQPALRTRVEKVLEENLGFPPRERKAFNMADYDLDPKDMRLLRQIEENGVKYISGTMSPAPSTIDELEPLGAAFDFYEKKGVNVLVLQPKYMGSRCQLYLFKDKPSETFQVSRNGWKVRGVDGKTPEEYQAYLEVLYSKYEHLLTNWKTDSAVLDGELLPWRALGAGFIDGTFTTYQELVRSEIELLSEDKGFAALTDFAAKVDVVGKTANLSAFELALANYTQNTPTLYKAFDILQLNKDFENISTSFERFAQVNDDRQIVVNTEDEDDVKAAFEFFKELTIVNGMEGVVVKPLRAQKGAPPYLKVRSPEYLRLVYGYDYPTRVDRLCRQKNISGKVATSIREFETATSMLTADDDFRKELIVKMIGEIKSEASLDPRL